MAAEAAGHDLDGRHALAGRGGLLERRGDGGFQGEVVGAQDDIDVGVLGQPRHQHGLAGVRADAGKADLAGLLGGLLSVDQIVGDLFRLAFGVQIPDIQVIGLQRLQTGIQIVERFLPGGAMGLARQRDAVALALERGAHHALVVALLVTVSRIEIGDAHIGPALNHAAVRSDHAAEGHAGDLQAGLAEGPVFELDVRGPLCGSLRFGTCGAGRGRNCGQSDPGHEKVAARRIHDASRVNTFSRRQYLNFTRTVRFRKSGSSVGCATQKWVAMRLTGKTTGI